MDAQALYECFAATLQPSQAARQAAELQLREAQKVPGFLGACLDILTTDGVNPGIKKAAAVFFKNRVIRRWQTNAADAVDNDEKPLIKDRLLLALVSVPQDLRNQLFPVLTTIITHDYPLQWPGLLAQTAELVQSQNPDSLYVGVLCLSEVVRSYRWKTNEDRPELDTIILEFFPKILAIANALTNDASFQAGSIVKLILKTYKFATYFDLPVALQAQGSVVEWGTLHVNIINTPYPANLLELDEGERALHSLCKCKKWAFANLYRLFTRYGSSSLSNKYEYPEFQALFIGSFVPSLLTVYFQLVEAHCNQTVWISGPSLYYLLSFIEAAVTQKATWPLIKPHVSSIISHFIFPTLLPSDETLENFEDDPQEYIHANFNFYDDVSSADSAAVALLVTLAQKRTKTCLELILQFAYTKLTELAAAPKDLVHAKQAESALRMVGAIAYKLVGKKSPYHGQMEGFLVQFIFPTFASEFGFLRARACEISCTFSDLAFQDQNNLATLFHSIMSCFNEDNLPVQLEAALALHPYLKSPAFNEAFGQVVVPAMQRLLELSNTIDHDALSGVMQEIVECFSEQLQPFGVDLMTKLVEQFMKLAVALNNEANVEVDDVDGDNLDDNSDKQMAAFGLLNTMVTVLLSFENSTDVILGLEQILAPVFEIVYKNDMEDYFAEVCELVENCTFLSRQISPLMWKVFELISVCFNTGFGCVYAAEFMPAITNFITYGASDMKANPAYVNWVFAIYTSIMKNVNIEEMGVNDLAYGAEIAYNFTLAMKEDAPQFAPQLTSSVIDRLVADGAEIMKNTATSIYMLNVIVAGLAFDIQHTLQALIEKNYMQNFFIAWFKFIPTYKRVFDMKASVLALLSVLSVSQADLQTVGINDSVIAECGVKLANLFSTLPGAITELDKQRKEYSAEDYNPYNDDFGEDDGEWVNEDAAENAADAEDEDYMKFLEEESHKLKHDGAHYDYDDDELVEDPLATTPLDTVNVYAVFRQVFEGLQSTDAAKFQVLTSLLSAEDKETLQQSAQFSA
ncbi:hypothetical protein BABINDRAFT_159495 [Babjeviella inositovora NRRL Y-12698]|uniref:Importin N-terminal domain-containing protein n=1 Tax=Babjeviella inositovora NRRL Y-12698 TaxID=984486 RepID=A0A1E3QZA7_9ASCO|nr:uncharacterized protein BABINDRAFT_159495 [Babjeviella inositovora NRRL Y-12698]ODQ83019.1 hypothetical protein BABINDRAFT_159495 [Babjeviella inositovora NRRL Y-12698]